MLDPKEKANELILKYLRVDNNTKEWINIYIAKQCALIAVYEMLISIDWHDFETPNKQIHFWQQVKQEIEQL